MRSRSGSTLSNPLISTRNTASEPKTVARAANQPQTPNASANSRGQTASESSQTDQRSNDGGVVQSIPHVSLRTASSPGSDPSDTPSHVTAAERPSKGRARGEFQEREIVIRKTGAGYTAEGSSGKESWHIPSLQNDVLRTRVYFFPVPHVPPELRMQQQEARDKNQNQFQRTLQQLSGAMGPPLPPQIEDQVIALINAAVDRGFVSEYILYVGAKTMPRYADNFGSTSPAQGNANPAAQATAAARHCATLLLAALQRRGIMAEVLASSEVAAARKPVAVLTELLNLANINARSVCVVSDPDTLQLLANRLCALDSDALAAAAVNHFEANAHRFMEPSKSLSRMHSGNPYDDAYSRTHQVRGDGGLSARGDIEAVEERLRRQRRREKRKRRQQKLLAEQQRAEGVTETGVGGGASSFRVDDTGRGSMILNNDGDDDDDDDDDDHLDAGSSNSLRSRSRASSKADSSRGLDTRVFASHLPPDPLQASAGRSTSARGKRLRKASTISNRSVADASFSDDPGDLELEGYRSTNQQAGNAGGSEDSLSDDSSDDDIGDLDEDDDDDEADDPFFQEDDAVLAATFGNEKVKVMVMPALIPPDAITEMAVIESVATQRSAQLLSRGYSSAPADGRGSPNSRTPSSLETQIPSGRNSQAHMLPNDTPSPSPTPSPNLSPDTPRTIPVAAGAAPPNPVLAALMAPTTRVCAVFPTRSCRASGHIANHIQCIIIPGQLAQTTVRVGTPDGTPEAPARALSPETAATQTKVVWSKESRKRLEWLLSLISSFHAMDVPYARRVVFFSTTPEGAATARYLLTMPRRPWKMRPTFLSLATPLRVAGALAALPPGSQAVIVASYNDALALTKALCFPGSYEKDQAQAAQLLDMHGYVELRCSILRSRSHLSAVALPSTSAFVTVDALRLRRTALYPNISTRMAMLSNVRSHSSGDDDPTKRRMQAHKDVSEFFIQRYTKESDRAPYLQHYSEFLEEVNLEREEEREYLQQQQNILQQQQQQNILQQQQQQNILQQQQQHQFEFDQQQLQALLSPPQAVLSRPPSQVQRRLTNPE